MRPTSPELTALLLHYAGQQVFPTGLSFARHNWSPPGIGHHIPPEARFEAGMHRTFGDKEFYAAVCFVDMVGFSERARGKSPKDVAAIVCPFLKVVIVAATQNRCFVDKTIGDEVMVVMPLFPDISHPLTDLAWFLFTVVEQMATTASDIQLRAGVALGKVIIEDIEAASFHEWTAFGNCVNGAKRLQSLPAPKGVGSEGTSSYRAVIGAVDSEYPDFLRDFQAWREGDPRGFLSAFLPPLRFITVRRDCEELKGVGRMCFYDSFLRTKTVQP